MIRFNNVTKTFSKENEPIKEVSFTIENGEFVYLVGHSGAGKTSLFRLLTREWKVSSGAIQVDHFELNRIKDQQLYLLRRRIGLVAQEDLFLPKRTIYENLYYCLEVLGIPKEECSVRIEQVLDDVGMTGYEQRFPNEVSVGQLKKVAIARALIVETPIIIADEPTANLDSKSAVEVMKLFYRINQKGKTVILSMHDSTMVNSVRNRVIELRNGRLLRDEKNGGYTTFSDPKDVYIW